MAYLYNYSIPFIYNNFNFLNNNLSFNLINFNEINNVNRCYLNN